MLVFVGITLKPARPAGRGAFYRRQVQNRVRVVPLVSVMPVAAIGHRIGSLVRDRVEEHGVAVPWDWRKPRSTL
jgi:hypothetical protein